MTTSTRPLTIPLLGMAMLFGAAAAPLPAHAKTSEQLSVPPSVIAFDQKAGPSLMVDYVFLPKDGYVAVYKSDDTGKPAGKPIGHTAIEGGDHRQLKIQLSEAPKPGERLWVSLYKDADKSAAFDPGAGDTPVWSKDALPAQNKVVVR